MLLSAIFQLYHGDQFKWWRKSEYPERPTDHGQATLSLADASGVGDMEMAGVRPSGYIVSTLRFLFVDQLISNLYTSIILRISSLSSKLGEIRKKKFL